MFFELSFDESNCTTSVIHGHRKPRARDFDRALDSYEISERDDEDEEDDTTDHGTDNGTDHGTEEEYEEEDGSTTVTEVEEQFIFRILHLADTNTTTNTDEKSDEKNNKKKTPSENKKNEIKSNKNNKHDQEEGGENGKEPPRSVIVACWESFKYLGSLTLLIFSVVLVMACIITKQTDGAIYRNMHPILSLILFWFFIGWLAMLEGGQISLSNLEQTTINNKHDNKDEDDDKVQHTTSKTHPLSLKNAKIAHQGDNMERIKVGSQFLVVLILFLCTMFFSAVTDATVFGLSDNVCHLFLSSSFALILIITTIGQLTTQVTSTSFGLDLINNHFTLYFVTCMSLAVEFTGLMHFTYLVQTIFSLISSNTKESKEPRRNPLQQLFFWTRILLSSTASGYAFYVTVSGIWYGKTVLGSAINPIVSVVIFSLLLCFSGMIEGTHAALSEVANHPEDDLSKHRLAHKHYKLVETGERLQSFLMGRKIAMTVCIVMIARITAFKMDTGDNIFGVSDGVQNFFNTGILGVIITTITASLLWRKLGEAFPIVFLSNPLVFLIIRVCLMLDSSGVCNASWVLARFQRISMDFQPDRVYLEGAEPLPVEPVTRRDKDIDRLVTTIRFTYSTVLFVFAFVTVMATICTQQTVATAHHGLHPVLVLVIFLFLIFWLALLEGAQGCIVGLRRVSMKKYSESHPVSYKNNLIAHYGNNTDRFIIGRQLLVVLVVFLLNFLISSVEGASVLGLSGTINELFLPTGISLILITLILGQLTVQVNAVTCMLDFINNRFVVYLVTYTSLAVELSGLLHSVYLFRLIFSKISGKSIESHEPRRHGIEMFFFCTRVAVSLIVLLFASAVTLTAMVDGRSRMWDGSPSWISIIAFFMVICFIGIMEGMQSALFAVANKSKKDLQNHTIARRNYDLAFSGQNLEALLIGRQICVTFCLFVLARLCSLENEAESDKNIFGVSNGIQNFFNTGLLGAVVITIIGSLAWRVIASSFPVAFLSNPMIFFSIRLCLLIEASGLCSVSWIIARWNKLLAGYQPDKVYVEGAPKQGRAPVTRRDKDIDIAGTVIKYGASLGLLIFSVVIVISLIFAERTKVARDVHPVVALLAVLFLILWLGMMEGGQVCLVGLQHVDKELYRKTHPATMKCTLITEKEGNMERFIIGRQFLSVLVVFFMNLCGAALADSSVLNLSEWLTHVFVDSGVGIIIMTIILGQLASQVNAASCMLDFINTHFMVFTVYVSLAIEASGLLHAAYLVQLFVSKLAGKSIKYVGQERSASQEALFWGRVVFSFSVLVYAFVITLSALFGGKTTMWGGVSPVISVIIFFALMGFVGMMEGMQIALFAVKNLPEEELKCFPTAQAACQLAFNGANLQAFLIGRQICLTICTFILARISTLNVDSNDENVFGVSNSLQSFFNIGLLGVVITTLVASLAWRMWATTFPLAFLSNPLVYAIIRLCLLVEASGVCSASWVLAFLYKQATGIQVDEMYIGTAEQRAAAAAAKELEDQERGECAPFGTQVKVCDTE